MKTTGFELTFTFLVLLSLSWAASAQTSVTRGDAVEATAKIAAIDRDARLVTLEDEDGFVETLYAGPQVKRFDELEVGDTVTFRFYESLVTRLRKAGDAPPSEGSGSEPKLVRGTGPKPSGTVSQQLTATVTIKAIDASVPSVVVATEDGHMESFKVDDPALLEGVEVGDHVDITYSAALVISVK